MTEMPHPPDPPEAARSLAGRLANAIWPTCLEVARLTSEQREHPLPRGTRFRLGFHRLLCRWCARYAKQLEFIHEASGRLPENLDKLGGPALDGEARARLKRSLRSS